MSETATADFLQYEALYKERPDSYKRKVAGFIALGYGYVALTVLVIVGFVVGGTLLFATGTLSLLWVDNFLKAGIPLVLVAGLMVRAIFVRIPRPEGVYLAGELKRQVSHEHGRLGSMVYRLNHTLFSAAQSIDEKARSGFKGMSFRFLDWFYRKFNVLTFAMRRAQEFEADAVSAQATNSQALSSSLCKLNALDEPLGRYWNEVWVRSRHLESNLSLSPFADMDGDELLGPDGLDDELVGITIEPDRRQEIAELIRNEYPEIRKMYAVEKMVEHFGSDRAVLVAFAANRYHDNVESDEQKWLDRVSEGIGRKFPEYFSSYRLILPKKGSWNEKLNGIEGALVYEGKESLGRRIWGGIRMAYSIAIVLVLIGFIGFLIYDWLTGS